jgi:hypothetical protein
VSPVSTPWIAPLNPKPDLTHYTRAFRGRHNGMLASSIEASVLSANAGQDTEQDLPTALGEDTNRGALEGALFLHRCSW